MSVQKSRTALREAPGAYLLDLQAAGRSPLTIISYRMVLTDLLRFLEERNVTDWPAVSPGVLRQYLAAHLENGSKASTMRTWGTIVSCFFHWLVQEGIVDDNPMSHVRRPKRPQRLIKTFTEPELRALFVAAERTYHPIRNKAIISLLVDCGLRKAELLAVTPGDYDAANSALIIHGKGRKVRILSMGKRCQQAFEAQLESMNGSLWGMDRGGLRDMIHALGERAGVLAYCHKFRHTFANRFLDAGGTIDELQYLMGHSEITTTMIYAAAGQEQRARRSHVLHSPLDALV